MRYAPIEYRGYKITRGNYTPYEFTHENYDGAEDGGDNRFGFGNTLDECFIQIDEQREGFCAECEEPLDDDMNCQRCLEESRKYHIDNMEDAADAEYARRCEEREFD